jgi:hypothetical protein
MDHKSTRKPGLPSVLHNSARHKRRTQTQQISSVEHEKLGTKINTGVPKRFNSPDLAYVKYDFANY